MSQNRRVHSLREHLRTPLYRNAYALMLNTGINAGLGMIYWVVAARLADGADDVGHATALISAMTLISAVTQLNFGSVLMRFLPRAGRQSKRLVLTAYVIAVGCAVVVATDVIGFFHWFGSDDSLLSLSGWMIVGFVASTAVWSIFSLQDGALTGLRRSVVVPVENGIYGAVKIVALFPFIAIFGASTGIFASWTVVTFLIVLPINWLIFRRYVPAHVERTAEAEQALEPRKIAKYISGDYAAGLFAQIYTTLLPVLVFTILGDDEAGYFFMAQVIGTALDRLSLSLSSSLTVEGAGNEADFARNARAVLHRGLILTGTAAVIVVLAAPWILQIFGTEYRENATTLLQLLAVASVPRVVSMVFGSVARIAHKTHYIAVITCTQAVILTGGSVILMPHLGITGVGVAAVAAQTVIVAFVLPRLLRATRPV